MKRFYKWHPDSDLFSLQLHRNFRVITSASSLSRMCRALLKVNLHYFCLSRVCIASKSDFGKYRHKHFGYSWEKTKTRCLLLLFFMNDRIWNFWEGILWFSGTNMIAVTVMHSCQNNPYTCFFQHDVKCSVGNLLYCSVHKQLVLDLAYITVSDS